MATVNLAQALLDPGCYPENPRRIYARDTHASRLFFTPRYVYKLKKPVDFGFLDFTTLDRRRFFCEEEVRLNAPFAPDTYLGVEPVRRDRDAFRVGSEQGEVVDYLVKMRRLPRARMLDHLVTRAAPGLTGEMERLAPRLLDLFARARAVEDIAPPRLCEALRFNFEENLAQTREGTAGLLAPSAWSCASAYTAHAFSEQGLAGQLLERAERSLVREGHGDLHCEHIWLGEPIRIYDCIEFSRRLRINDPVSELAFLLMDLDMRERHDLARQLLALCREGHPELRDPQLLRFYQFYRAWVRGKVGCLTCHDPGGTDTERQRAARAARGYFALALGYLCRPFLAITCGPMGSGKSTFAAALARATTAERLRSDVVRKELLELPPETRVHLPFASGIYAPGHTRRTYAVLLERAEAALRGGSPVVVDAAFARREQRVPFRELAARLGVPFRLLQLEAPEALTLARLAERERSGRGPSDGRVALYRDHLARFEFPEEHEMIEKIDSDEDVDYNVQLFLGRFLSDHGWYA